MDIAGNRWRREREEFMHPRYCAREEILSSAGERCQNAVKSGPKPNLCIWSAVPI